MLKIAVMQPYLFPYIGYIQLVHAVDVFVFLDDANYINKGWINRNQIIVGGKPALFTVPLKDASQNKAIHEIDLGMDEKWKNKFLKTLEMNYKNSPFFGQGMELVSHVLGGDEEKISDLIYRSFFEIKEKLRLNVQLLRSSNIEAGRGLKGQYRILEICKHLGADHYINPPGGRELYDHALFLKNNIALKFIKPTLIPYDQNQKEFLAGLSFIDVCMYNSYNYIGEKLMVYELEN
jgi:hypothetical protein